MSKSHSNNFQKSVAKGGIKPPPSRLDKLLPADRLAFKKEINPVKKVSPSRLDKLLPNDRLAFKKAVQPELLSKTNANRLKEKMETYMIVFYLTIVFAGALIAYLTGGITALKHFVIKYL